MQSAWVATAQVEIPGTNLEALLPRPLPQEEASNCQQPRLVTSIPTTVCQLTPFECFLFRNILNFSPTGLHRSNGIYGGERTLKVFAQPASAHSSLEQPFNYCYMEILMFLANDFVCRSSGGPLLVLVCYMVFTTKQNFPQQRRWQQSTENMNTSKS